jgi:hypothetical protein
MVMPFSRPVLMAGGKKLRRCCAMALVLKRYKVATYDDLKLAIRANKVSDSIVELGDGTRALVLIEGGGDNSLGGCRGEFFVLEKPTYVEEQTVSIPLTEDRSYNWWKRARVIYPFDAPLLIEERSERYGEWSPAGLWVHRYWVHPDGTVTEVPIVEEVEA